MLLTRLLTIRSMRSRSLRFLLSGFGIMLGVASILAIRATNQTALNSIVTLFESTSGKARLSIVSTDGEGFSERSLEKIDNVSGIMAATPLVYAQTDLADRDSNEQMAIGFFGTNSGGIILYGIIPSLESATRDYVLTQGSFLGDDLKKQEIVLVETFAAEENIRVGDWAEIVTPNGPEKFKVVGLIAREGPGQTNNGSFGVIPIQAAQHLFNRGDDIDQVDIVPANPDINTAELSVLRTELQDKLGRSYSVIYPSGQGERMTQMLQNYQIGLNFMSGIALFVGAFLIYNAFAMTVVERTREFGMLRTIGMTRAQIMGQVLIEALAMGIIGTLLGLGMGILLSRGLTRLMEFILNQELGNIQMGQQNILFSLLIGVTVTILAAGLPAWQAGRISPMEALRVRGKTKEGWIIQHGWIIGSILLAGSIIILIANPFPYDVQFRLGSMTVFGLFTGATLLVPVTASLWERLTRPILKFLYGTAGSLGSRNIQRSRLRTTLTVAALMVGVAMVIMVRGMTGSFSSDLRSWMQSYLGGDIYITSSVRLRSDIARRIKTVEGVHAVAPVRYFKVKWQTPAGETEELDFMATDTLAYTQITNFVFSGRQVDPQLALERLTQGRSIFISSVLAEKYDLSAGDSIQLRTRAGFSDFEIAGVVVDFYNQGMVIQGDWGTMQRYFHIRDASTLMVKVEPGQSIPQVQARIEELYGKRYHLRLESNESIRARALNLMDQAFRMFDVMALIAIVVGSLGVINTLAMSVMERTQEIGMLRAIGMTRSQIVRMVLAEAIMMGVIGGALGLATGVILARILFIGMTTMSGYELTFALPPEGIAISVVMALIVSQLAAIPPAVRAARVRILEAVHYE